MPRITFTETRVVQDGLAGTKDETRFEAGKTYTVSEASAEHWISRGVARYASEADTKEGEAKPSGKKGGQKAGGAKVDTKEGEGA